MELSQNDHVDVGSGWLYAPPFVGAYFLYRLFDCNCSVLIHHRPAACVSSFGSLPSLSFGNVTLTTNIASTEGPPTHVHVHCDIASASRRLPDLLKLPATHLALSREVSALAHFGDVAVRVESFLLHFSEKLIVAGELPPVGEFRVVESDYRVRGRIGVSFWPVGVRPKQLSVWKVSVENTTRKTTYALHSACDWSLTALHIEGGFEPTLAVTLEKV